MDVRVASRVNTGTDPCTKSARINMIHDRQACVLRGYVNFDLMNYLKKQSSLHHLHVMFGDFNVDNHVLTSLHAYVI